MNETMLNNDKAISWMTACQRNLNDKKRRKIFGKIFITVQRRKERKIILNFQFSQTHAFR